MKELKDIVGIDFEEGQQSVEILAKRFKEELSNIGKPFAFNENDPDFIPLRKLYARAVLDTFSLDNPEQNDPIFKELQKLDIGIEFKYYEDLVVPRLRRRIGDKFFVDSKHPLLYNMTDDREYLSYTETRAEFNILNISGKASQAVRPDTSTLNLIRQQLDLDGQKEQKWPRVYEERIYAICGYPTRAILGQDKYQEMLPEIRKKELEMK